MVVETTNKEPHDIAQIQQTDLDETIPNDFEAFLKEQEQDRAYRLSSFPRMVNEDKAKDILQLWQNGKRRNWDTRNTGDVITTLSQSLQQLLKDELLSVAKCVNKNVTGTEFEIKVKKITKAQLVEQLVEILDLDKVATKQISRNTKKQPRTLQDLSINVLKKKTIPKTCS